MTDQEQVKIAMHKVTKGKRSYFFEDRSIDQVMTFVLELMTEVIMLRDRHDLLERLLDERGVVSREDLLGYDPGPEAEAERVAERFDVVSRVLRIHQPDGRQDG